MEPPKPKLQTQTFAAPTHSREEAMEYEQLLALRFQADPDMPKDPAMIANEAKREQRIQELYQKIYGAMPAGSR
jgi:hypothetical protein